ncbi:MAG: hypothetical protein U0Q15_04525 [Kineosporiaceae bacterium]
MSERITTDAELPPDPGPLMRVLRLRGGPWDGATWTGEIAIGFRIACGTRPWPPSSIYVVTDEQELSAAGVVEFVAVPGEVEPTLV